MPILLQRLILPLIACFAMAPNVALGDDPESAVIEKQLYRLNFLIEAMEAADALPVESETEAAKLKYRIGDCLSEVIVAAYEDFAVLSETKVDHPWPSDLTNKEWARRLLQHYLNHHTSSGNERWTSAVRRICLSHKGTVTDLFGDLPREKQDRLLRLLQSGNDKGEIEERRQLVEQLNKRR
ncbi:MAG TPA: hypothetical protein VMN36_03875 [Verrucomicrobiales bacterium]|nr:hypothetical protein [Verrucomicrobiales bacterium]